MPRDLEAQRAARRRYYEQNKALVAERARRWKRANPEKAKESARKYYARNRDKDCKKSLRLRYGITPEMYAAQLAAQNGVCALCFQPPKGTVKTRRLWVDHCHTSGKVRGLLCPACNLALGKIWSDPVLLARAAAYVAAGGVWS